MTPDQYKWLREVHAPREFDGWPAEIMAPLLAAAGLPSSVRGSAIAWQHREKLPKKALVGISIGRLHKRGDVQEIEVSFAGFDSESALALWTPDLDKDFPGRKSLMLLFDKKTSSYRPFDKELVKRLRSLAP